MLLISVLQVVSCAPRTPPADPSPAQQGGTAGNCLVGDNVQPRADLVIAVTDSINPANAPAGHNDSERFVFRQLYETLVVVDCAGNFAPGIAQRWDTKDGRVWDFHLRNDARFWDDSPVTARAVIESLSNAPGELAGLFASMAILGERELQVELHTATRSPSLFAHPSLAVVRRGSTIWPAGTSHFRPDTSYRAHVVVRSNEPGANQSIEFRVYDTADQRSALDAAVDGLVTSDATTLEYARALPAYHVAPLGWSRTYALVTLATDTIEHLVPQAVLQALARNAVRADTRPATPPFAWRARDCEQNAQSLTPVVAVRPSRTLLYERDDTVARALAERIAALTWPSSQAPAWLRQLLPPDYSAAGPPAAVGLSEAALLDALQSKRALAVVLPLSRFAGAYCFLPLSRAGQLAVGDPTLRVTPLLDARDHLIHKPGTGSWRVEGDGTLRIQWFGLP